MVFQDGRLREVVNVQTTELDHEEISWVEAHLRDWDHPITPCDSPGLDRWDPHAVRPADVRGRKGMGLPREDEAFGEAPQEDLSPEARPENPKITVEELIGEDDQVDQERGRDEDRDPWCEDFLTKHAFGPQDMEDAEAAAPAAQVSDAML